ncbi:MAG: polysaccharide biosynthesis protein, partial [Bacteroidota bacterium]|nr:polysaccharide biosynthesis protein [Bacteroidota bacterium]
TNNVYNMEALLEAAIEHHPQHVFAVSTDKASNPVNIMGGSKKMMEHLIMAYADQVNVTTARFANVAFSNGSLLDGFNKRIQMGQPISAPADVRRYFVTPAESGHICMLASLLGEKRDIFFPKLAESEMMTFSEIADRYLFELGYKPDLCQTEDEAKEKSSEWNPGSKSYPVFYFESDTTGEKPYEEFYTQNEITDLNSFRSLGIVKGVPQYSITEIKGQVANLKEIFDQPGNTKELIVEALKKFMPEFDHMEKGKNLDSKM